MGIREGRKTNWHDLGSLSLVGKGHRDREHSVGDRKRRHSRY